MAVVCRECGGPINFIRVGVVPRDGQGLICVTCWQWMREQEAMAIQASPVAEPVAAPITQGKEVPHQC